MSVLQQTLLTPERRPQAVQALTDVVEHEVQAKRGLSGAAIRAGYAAVTKARAGVVPGAVDRMLPDFLDALEPYWARWSADRQGSFGTHLSADGDAVANALLAVTDARAERTSQAVFKKAYSGLRGKAVENVKTALPALGDAISRLMA